MAADIETTPVPAHDHVFPKFGRKAGPALIIFDCKVKGCSHKRNVWK